MALEDRAAMKKLAALALIFFLTNPTMGQDDEPTFRQTAEAIVKNLENRDAMVAAIAAVFVAHPPQCRTRLPDDRMKRVKILAMNYGFDIKHDKRLQRAVAAKVTELSVAMARDKAVREFTCNYGAVINTLAEAVTAQAQD
jgi:hypothetical protein